MEVKQFNKVIDLGNNKVLCDIKTDLGNVTIKRTFRKHTKEIRELQKQGIYCFEIQGVLYWYRKLQNTSRMVEYKKPEDFRSQNRKINTIYKSSEQGQKTTNKTKVDLNGINLEKPKQIKEQKEIKEFEETEIKHEKFEQIKTCIENDIPVYLVGEAGTGKNHVIDQISWELGLEFYFTNSIQQEYKLTGFIDAGGVYHETEFYRAFKNGGIFFLDEIDASIPEVLVLLNMAIANKYFEFPNGTVNAHKDFRVVAAGNTVGSGADEMYTGRMVLDQATLDRFAIIEFGYDRNIELSLAKGNEELVNFIETLRNKSKENNIRTTFSYRCITMVTKLEQCEMDLKTILKIAVFKGLENDTINCFVDFYSNNKYFKALKEMQV